MPAEEVAVLLALQPEGPEGPEEAEMEEPLPMALLVRLTPEAVEAVVVKMEQPYTAVVLAGMAL